MNGFIIEYVTDGWPYITVQLGATEATCDPTREVLSIWEFKNGEECNNIISELRGFRLHLMKEKV